MLLLDAKATMMPVMVNVNLFATHMPNTSPALTYAACYNTSWILSPNFCRDSCVHLSLIPCLASNSIFCFPLVTLSDLKASLDNFPQATDLIISFHSSDGLGDEFVSVLCSVTDSPSTSLVFCHRGNICLCSCVHIGKIYKRASEAYEALSTRLGEQKFLFEDRSCTLVFCH
ncbi:hypothetical protein F2Q68_00044498 [Brassica cretica]|uniref:Uncharacterized protein n=1 Tax=Brassica cretica TaxID=69181 RepID=A0A8S9LG21_BRACR|nr:hypothetical protein F2Q68_00044498 [Brassica cretica]